MVVFLAGPAIVTFFWVLEVYVFDKALYITFDERVESLLQAMPIGIVIGLIASVAVAVRIAMSSD